MNNVNNNMEFRNKTSFYVVGIIATVLCLFVALVFLFSDDFSYEDEKIARMLGYILLIATVFVGYTFWKKKNFFIRISENGIQTDKINEISWNNIDNIETKIKKGKIDVEVLIISYKSGNNNKMMKIPEGQIYNFDKLKKILLEKFQEFD